MQGIRRWFLPMVEESFGPWGSRSSELFVEFNGAISLFPVCLLRVGRFWQSLQRASLPRRGGGPLAPPFRAFGSPATLPPLAVLELGPRGIGLSVARGIRHLRRERAFADLLR